MLHKTTPKGGPDRTSADPVDLIGTDMKSISHYSPPSGMNANAKSEIAFHLAFRTLGCSSGIDPWQS